MIKTLIADTVVRTIFIFFLVFVMSGAAMGVITVRSPDAYAVQDLHAARYGNALALYTPPTSAVDMSSVSLSYDVEQPYSNDFIEEYPSYEPEPLPVGEDSSQETPAPRFVVREVGDIGHLYLSQIPLSPELQHYTMQQCAEQQIDYALVLALMWRESRFQSQAVNLNYNGTQDSGIMQINDVNKGWLHHELAIDDLMDPYQNIDAGTEMLGRFVRKYGEHNALLAYQYGESGMKAKLAQGMTTNYQIEQLYAKQAEYQALLDAASNSEATSEP